MFPEAEPRETLRFEGKLTVSLATSLDVISSCIVGNFEAGNSLNLALTAIVG